MRTVCVVLVRNGVRIGVFVSDVPFRSEDRNVPTLKNSWMVYDPGLEYYYLTFERSIKLRYSLLTIIP